MEMKDPDFHITQCSLGMEEGGQNRDKSVGRDLSFFSFLLIKIIISDANYQNKRVAI